MKKTFQFSALTLSLMLVACGPAETQTAEVPAAAPTAAEIAANAPQAQVTEDGPQIGDKIADEADRVAEVANNSLAAQAAKAREAEKKLEARGVRQLAWEELMPEGEEERLAEMYQAQMAAMYGPGAVAEGSAGDVGVQIGTFNVVKDLDGQLVRLPGYTVPFEYGAKAEVTEFLLVPYFGACLHNPPPPPNQTVFVKMAEPMALKDISQAVWVEGTIRTQTQSSDLADTAYTIEIASVEPYEY